MNTPGDPFSDTFDSIEIDPARAPSADAFDHAIAFCAPHLDSDPLLVTSAAAPDREAPGFYLLDDAQGRFIVDRDTGVVTLRDDAVLADERGQVHGARLRVVEVSGYAYTIDLALRLTGRVPQMVGGEDLLRDFDEEPAPPARNAAYRAQSDEIELHLAAWADFGAAAGHAKPLLGSEHAAFGALIAAPLPNLRVGFAGLTIIEDVPPPHSRTAIWSV